MQGRAGEQAGCVRRVHSSKSWFGPWMIEGSQNTKARLQTGHGRPEQIQKRQGRLCLMQLVSEGAFSLPAARELHAIHRAPDFEQKGRPACTKRAERETAVLEIMKDKSLLQATGQVSTGEWPKGEHRQADGRRPNPTTTSPCGRAQVLLAAGRRPLCSWALRSRSLRRSSTGENQGKAI